MQRFKICLSFMLAMAGWGLSHAQENFPDRPVKLIVPVAAGGGVDTAFRTLAPYWSELLGQQVVVAVFAQHRRLDRRKPRCRSHEAIGQRLEGKIGGRRGLDRVMGMVRRRLGSGGHGGKRQRGQRQRGNQSDGLHHILPGNGYCPGS